MIISTLDSKLLLLLTMRADLLALIMRTCSIIFIYTHVHTNTQTSNHATRAWSKRPWRETLARNPGENPAELGLLCRSSWQTCDKKEATKRIINRRNSVVPNLKTLVVSLWSVTDKVPPLYPKYLVREAIKTRKRPNVRGFLSSHSYYVWHQVPKHG